MKKLLLLLLSFAFAVSAFGQVSLEVSVVNKFTGKAVTNLSVTLANDAIGYNQVQTTNSQGKVFFRGLTTSGSYTALTEDTDAYYPLKAPNIIFRSNTNKSVTMAISAKSDTELGQITVNADNSVARVNTIDAEVSADLNVEQIEEIPIRARDFEQALYRLPNVVQATQSFDTAPDVSVNGGNPLSTNYLIDGLDNNENFLGGPKFPIPIGFIQNITVLSNNYSAEFGQSVDGVFNVTTKSGSNDYDGEVFFVSRPGPVIDADSPFIQDNDAQAGFQRYQTGFGIGGPIVKDKTFFYLNVEGTANLNDNVLQVPQLGFSQTLRGYDYLGLFSGKIDQHWSDNFRSSLRANVGIVDFERQGGGISGGGILFPTASYIEDRDSYVIANKNTYVSSAFTSETSFQYSRFYWNFSRPINPDDSPDVTLVDASTGLPFARLGAPGFPFIEYENTGQVKQKFTFTRGNHQIKTGAGFITSDFSLSGGGNPFGSYIVALSPQQINQLASLNKGAGLTINDVPSNAQVVDYQVNLRSEPFGETQNRFNVYAEDLWSVNNRLNLTFGLRYDYDNLSKGGSDDGDYNNFGPRFDFNYRLNDRSVIRGGYGRFYQKVVYSIISDSREFNRNSADIRTQIQALVAAGVLPQDTDLDQVLFDGPLQASVPGVGYLQGPSRQQLQGQRNNVFSNTIRIANPNGYDNPYSDQFVIGYQRQLTNDVLFTADLFYNRTRDEYRLRELNAPTSYPVGPNFQPGDVRNPADADASRTVPIFTDAQGGFAIVNGDTLRGASRGISTVESKGASDYYAATLTLKKDRAEDDFSFQLFYTLSRLRTNTEGFNFRATDANRFDNEFGPSVNDRTHVIEGFFTYYPANGLSITTTTQLQSGQPINRIPDATIFGTTDLNGNGIGRGFEGIDFNPVADRTPGASRNSDRLPWAATFDVGIQYKLPIHGDQKLEFRADVFNLFNAENLSGFANDGSPSNQLQIGPASSGRFVQRNASPPRQFQFSMRYLF